MKAITEDIYFQCCISSRSKKRKIFKYANCLDPTSFSFFQRNLGLTKVAKRHKSLFWKQLFGKLDKFY